MKLPSQRRINFNDYNESEQELINTLASTINPNIEVLYEALNRKLTLSDNIRCTTRDVELKVSAEGVPIAKTVFTLDFNEAVNYLIVANVRAVDGNGFPTSAPFVSWVQTNEGIQINHVTGLPAGKAFRLRIVAFV